MPIRQLSPSVVNKIAAGEVIERPASVVKELLENAVDAGATRIDVAVEQGGIELVRVVDNGCGIAADELPLAVAPHATSKICRRRRSVSRRHAGLSRRSAGFDRRSQPLMIRSRPADADGGAELDVNGGHVEPIAPCGCAVGTTIEVHNLFFNTPVRRKFLRTAQTEWATPARPSRAWRWPIRTSISRCGTTTSWSTICRRRRPGASGSPRSSAPIWPRR